MLLEKLSSQNVEKLFPEEMGRFDHEISEGGVPELEDIFGEITARVREIRRSEMLITLDMDFFENSYRANLRYPRMPEEQDLEREPFDA